MGVVVGGGEIKYNRKDVLCLKLSKLKLKFSKTWLYHSHYIYEPHWGYGQLNFNICPFISFQIMREEEITRCYLCYY